MKPGHARALLLLLLALIVGAVASVLQPGAPSGTGATGDGYGDIDLYRETAAKVATGADYYSSVIAAQLQHGYPTSPFTVVRLPTLTFVQVALGEVGSSVALATLAVAALLAMAVRLERSGTGFAERVAALLLMTTGLALTVVGPVAWFHDAWAGVLIVLAIVVHSEKVWWPSVVLGLAAVCVRELALPFLLVMLVIAWPRRREAAAWAGAIVAFCGLYVLHALAVQAAQPPVPVSSQGWVQFGGAGFIIASVRMSSVLGAVPAVVTAVLVPLALFGWLFSGARLRAAPLTCAAFIACFLVLGRGENAYWGLLYTALLLAGLAFAPRGLLTSVRAAFGASTGSAPTARR